jgi:IS30 family transposase
MHNRFRQYILKKQAFNNYNDDRIKNIQLKINRRHRKKFNFEELVRVFYKRLNNKVAFNA